MLRQLCTFGKVKNEPAVGSGQLPRLHEELVGIDEVLEDLGCNDAIERAPVEPVRPPRHGQVDLPHGRGVRGHRDRPADAGELAKAKLVKAVEQ